MIKTLRRCLKLGQSPRHVRMHPWGWKEVCGCARVFCVCCVLAFSFEDIVDNQMRMAQQLTSDTEPNVLRTTDRIHSSDKATSEKETGNDKPSLLYVVGWLLLLLFVLERIITHFCFGGRGECH